MASRSPYHQAADLVNRIMVDHNDPSNNKEPNLKAFVYDAKTGNLTCSTKTYALVSKMLAHRAALLEIAQHYDYFHAKNKGLLYVLLCELLFGQNQTIVGGGALKRQIMQQEASMRRHLKDTNNAKASD